MDHAPAGEAEARFDIANRLFLRLYQASNLMHRTGTRAVSGFGATTQQWAVLGALSRPAARARGMTVKEFGGFPVLSCKNLTAVRGRWEAVGHLVRDLAPGDGRLRHVRLTPAGARVWEAMLLAIRAYYAQALEGFTTEECVTLFRLLDRLRGSLAAMAEPEGE
ncbi:MAG: MarR family winged helix-turn-helix transcriptional regulator [Roseococcus sp.]